MQVIEPFLDIFLLKRWELRNLKKKGVFELGANLKMKIILPARSSSSALMTMPSSIGYFLHEEISYVSFVHGCPR